MQNTITIPIEEYIELLEYKKLLLQNVFKGPINDQHILEIEEQIAKLRADNVPKTMAEALAWMVDKKPTENTGNGKWYKIPKLTEETNEKSQAYMEGYNADEQDHNPYELGTDDHAQWRKGWLEGAVENK